MDLETTGFSPGSGDRVIEIAIQRIDENGRIEDEFSTLVNPEGRDTGPVFVHHITNEAVEDAPIFAEIAEAVIQRLDGAVVVAHNAEFEERFLTQELALSSNAGLHFPALDSLWLSRRCLAIPNHKLATLVDHYAIPHADAHSALGDVRALGAILPRLISAHDKALTYPLPLHVGSGTPTALPRLATRATNLRKGDEGWMRTLTSRLPMSGSDVSDEVAFAYFDCLTSALTDGRIVGTEAKELARIAGRGGLGSQQVIALNQRFLENLRDAAFADSILTEDELKTMNRAAVALGVPEYFDDLQATSILETSAISPIAKKPTKRRCGYCRQPGHYRPNCPELQRS